MISVTYGSCVDLDFAFFDEEGVPQDLSMDTFAVIPIRPQIWAEAELTDIGDGRIHLHLSAENALQLVRNVPNTFRISQIGEDGCADNTDIIEVLPI